MIYGRALILGPITLGIGAFAVASGIEGNTGPTMAAGLVTAFCGICTIASYLEDRQEQRRFRQTDQQFPYK